jgi:hypothetical protein
VILWNVTSKNQDFFIEDDLIHPNIVSNVFWKHYEVKQGYFYDCILTMTQDFVVRIWSKLPTMDLKETTHIKNFKRICFSTVDLCEIKGGNLLSDEQFHYVSWIHLSTISFNYLSYNLKRKKWNYLKPFLLEPFFEQDRKFYIFMRVEGKNP